MDMALALTSTTWKPTLTAATYYKSKEEFISPNFFSFDLKKFNDKELSQAERDALLYSWLLRLHNFLSSSDDKKLNDSGWEEKTQSAVISQIHTFFIIPTPPCTHELIAACLSQTYKSGPKVTELNTSVQKCIELLRTKQNESIAQANTSKGCAVRVMTKLYLDHGRMTGPLGQEAFQLLLKNFKQADIIFKCCILKCMETAILMLGSALFNSLKDILKLCRSQLVEKNTALRQHSAKCLINLIPLSWDLFSTSDPEQLITTAVKAMEGAGQVLRLTLATLCAVIVQQLLLSPESVEKSKNKKISLEAALFLLHQLYQKNSAVQCRAGLVLVYLELARLMGMKWLDINMPKLIKTGLILLTNSKGSQSELLTSRKFVLFLLCRLTFRLHGEELQLRLARVFCQMIEEYISNDNSYKRERGISHYSQQILTPSQAAIGTILLTLGELVKRISTLSAELIQESMASEDSPSMLTGAAIKAVSLGLENKHPYCRASALWVLQCLSLSVPTHTGLLVDWALNKLTSENLPPSDINNYSLAVAALVRASSCSNLGLPLTKAKSVLSMSEDMLFLESVTNLHDKLFRVRSSWYLLCSLISLGVSFVRPILSKLLALWRSSFPHSPEELRKEKSSIDNQSLQLQVEHRIGALTSIKVFIEQCRDLQDEDVHKKLRLPVESAIAVVSSMPKIIKSSETNLAYNIPMLKLSLYQLLLICPEDWLDESMNSLLRDVVAEFVQPDTAISLQTTLAWHFISRNDLIALGIIPQYSETSLLEELLKSSTRQFLGSVEAVPNTFYLENINPHDNSNFLYTLPIPRALVDCSIQLFGRIFNFSSDKHKLQLITHFKEVLKQAKPNRIHAVLFNLSCAIYISLKMASEKKKIISSQDIIQSTLSFLLIVLNSHDPLLGCLASESIARLCQVVSQQLSKQCIAQLLKHTEETLQTTKDFEIKAHYCYMLACLHSYVGLGSQQNLGSAFKLLSEMTQQSSFHLVVWSLYSLSRICDAGGPLFRQQVHPSVTLVHETIYNAPSYSYLVYRSAGLALGSLIDSLGPELEGMLRVKERILQCIEVLRSNTDPMVQGVAIVCMQKVLLFCPQDMKLETLVPFLLSCLNPLEWPEQSPHPFPSVASSAISCLRQCVQKEAVIVWQITQNLDIDLIEILLKLLDCNNEHMAAMIRDIKEVLDYLLSVTYANDLSIWINLCYNALCAEQTSLTKEFKQEESQGDKIDRVSQMSEDFDTTNENDGEEDEDLKGFTHLESVEKKSVTRKWETQVILVELLRKLFELCTSDPDIHFDLHKAEDMKTMEGGDYLVLHMANIVKIVCRASTGSMHDLRYIGLMALQDFIALFSSCKDPYLPGHLMLELYQAQIGAAFRPAFQSDIPPKISALACRVSGEWIVSGVMSNSQELEKVFRLLESSLNKVEQGSHFKHLYGDAMITLETLTVLVVWAEIYYRGHNDLDNAMTSTSTLLSRNMSKFVEPHIKLLSESWFHALNDYALLNISSHQSSLLAPEQCYFFTLDSHDQVTSIYRQNWIIILKAVSIYILEDSRESSVYIGKPLVDKMCLILGLNLQTLFFPLSVDKEDTIHTCLFSLRTILKATWIGRVFQTKSTYPAEILTTLHRLTLAKQDIKTMQLVMKVVLVLVESLITSFGDEIFQNDSQSFDNMTEELLRICILYLNALAPEILPETHTSYFNVKAQLTIHIDEILVMIYKCLAKAPLLSSLAVKNRVITVCQLLFINFFKHHDIGASVESSVLGEFRFLIKSCKENGDDKSLQNVICCGLVEVIKELQIRPNAQLVVALSIFSTEKPDLLQHYGGLLTDCTDIFNRIFKDRNTRLVLIALASLKKMFLHKDRTFAHTVINYISPHLFSMVISPPYLDVLASVMSEIAGCFEAMLSQITTLQSKPLLAAIIQVFISFLKEQTELRTSDDAIKKLHSISLSSLQQILPLYPTQFKEIMVENPIMKRILETSLLAQKQNILSNSPLSGQPLGSINQNSQRDSSIKPTLNIDFSKYTS